MAVRNYGGNVRFTPRRRAEPRSVEELTQLVRASQHLRAVGAAHSWSPAIVTDDTLVSLDRMRGVIALDRAAMQVTVQGGMRLRELSLYLAKQGLALGNLGSIDSQSVAGLIATGTHGTGRGFRCVAAQVARLELVDGTGQLRTLPRGEPDFAGAVVGLGALGRPAARSIASRRATSAFSRRSHRSTRRRSGRSTCATRETCSTSTGACCPARVTATTSSRSCGSRAPTICG